MMSPLNNRIRKYYVTVVYFSIVKLTVTMDICYLLAKTKYMYVEAFLIGLAIT